MLFVGQVRKVEGKMSSRPVKKGNICREMEEKRRYKRGCRGLGVDLIVIKYFARE